MQAIPEELRKKEQAALDKLSKKVAAQKKLLNIDSGGAMEEPPPDYVETDPQRRLVNTRLYKAIEPENGEYNEVLREIVALQPLRDPATLKTLGPDNVWVWGGPTPYWGGTTAPDTLVRAAEFFGVHLSLIHI